MFLSGVRRRGRPVFGRELPAGFLTHLSRLRTPRRAFYRRRPVLASRRSRVLTAALLLAVLGGCWWWGRPYARSAALVVRAAGLQGWLRTLGDRAAHPFTEEDLTVPCRHRPL